MKASSIDVDQVFGSGAKNKYFRKKRSLMDDEVLLGGLRDHDKEVIRYIFSQFFPMIEHLVKTNGGGSREEAEDVFMNALEVFYLKLQEETFNLTCAFSTLLFEICRRQWLKVLNQKKRLVRVTFPDSKILMEEDFTAALEQAERYELYREKFEEISPGCREILNLFLEGNSMKQIAEKLGFASEEYARKRKFNCKKKIDGPGTGRPIT